MLPQFVVGLVLDRNTVLLMLKNHPPHLAGLWNGLGGKVDAGETPLTALVRECREEAGIVVPEADWRLVVTLIFPDKEVLFYTTELTGEAADQAESLTDEEVAWHFCDDALDAPLAPHLGWILVMCRDKDIEPPVVQCR